MTRQQYRRMCVFALRMVPQAIGGGRWRKVLRNHVREVLSRLNQTAFSCHWSHIVNWDHMTDLPGDDGTAGFAWRDGRMLLCDFVAVYCENEGLDKELEDSRGNCRVVETKVATALQCCLRAACDLAAEPSDGVLGFTVGDLRETWSPKPVPKWVKDWFEGDFDTFKSESAIWL